MESPGDTNLSSIGHASPVKPIVLFFAAMAAVAGHAAGPPPKGILHPFIVAVGGHPLHLQLALEPAELDAGLVVNRALGADDGMLFAYAVPRRMTFGTRSVAIPLDVGFFDSRGVLREIHALYPYHAGRAVSLGADLRFAIEVSQGWFARHAVGVGAQLDLHALAAALRARGFDPKAYGL